MRIIILYICQTLLGLAFYNLTYMATLRLDFFEWGNSQHDGLYLLFVPIVILPTILITSVVKYFVTKKLDVEIFYKWSFTGYIFLSLICSSLVVADVMWAGVVISLLTMLVLIIETVTIPTVINKRT